MEMNTLNYHFDKIFLAYGAQYPPKQFLRLLQWKHDSVDTRGKKKLLTLNFSFQEKSIEENTNIK